MRLSPAGAGLDFRVQRMQGADRLRRGVLGLQRFDMQSQANGSRLLFGDVLGSPFARGEAPRSLGGGATGSVGLGGRGTSERLDNEAESTQAYRSRPGPEEPGFRTLGRGPDRRESFEAVHPRQIGLQYFGSSPRPPIRHRSPGVRRSHPERDPRRANDRPRSRHPRRLARSLQPADLAPA